MGDAVMPAERVFVEEYPEISHAKRHCRKIGCEDAPATQSTGGPPFVEAEQFQSRQTQAGSRPGIDDQQVLVSGPEHDTQTAQNSNGL